MPLPENVREVSIYMYLYVNKESYFRIWNKVYKICFTALLLINMEGQDPTLCIIIFCSYPHLQAVFLICEDFIVNNISYPHNKPVKVFPGLDAA